MLKLGRWNNLQITRFSDYGAYLDAGEFGEILMPNAYVEKQMRVGDKAQVFVYLDQEERLVATTETPKAQVGDFAYLKVAWTNKYGAFMDWGLMKDLFVPFREQKRTMLIDNYYLVHIYIDEETHRIVGSAKVEKWLRRAPSSLYRGMQVDMIVQQKTPLGFKVIVENSYSGLIYDNQTYQILRTGDKLKGYIVNIRPDGKLDISAQPIGKSRFRDFSETLYEELERCGGMLPYSDKSSSEAIAERFKVSKKTFKKAIGNLYKAHKITIKEDKIELVNL